MSEPFRTIVADPPWPFRDRMPPHRNGRRSRGAGDHYSLMGMHDIGTFLAVAAASSGIEIARDARLFLWRVGAEAEAAEQIVRAWGFRRAAELTWLKESKAGSGRLHFGLGRTVRYQHEVCVIGVRGRPPLLSRSVPSTFLAPATKHSAKPDEFYEIVEKLSPGPYLELFARRERCGWTCVGDELGC